MILLDLFFSVFNTKRRWGNNFINKSPRFKASTKYIKYKKYKIWEDKEGSSPTDILKDILINLNLNGKNIGVEYDSYGLTGRNTLKLNNSLKGFAIYKINLN